MDEIAATSVDLIVNCGLIPEVQPFAQIASKPTWENDYGADARTTVCTNTSTPPAKG
jgi:hypothetical protein